MKATGIVRRIDDLGRVVIPKEIRRTLRIREGDPLEIFVDREGEIILKKYSPISELGDFAKEYAESLSEHSGHFVLIADRDAYIAASGGPKKDYLNKSIGKTIEESMGERTTDVVSSLRDVEVIEDQETKHAYVVSPIIANGDPIGAVVMLSEEDQKLNDVEKALCETAAGFLARQMEQ